MAEEQPQPEEKKKEKKSGPRGAPAWMVTYSDLVTLLLTFFVLLLSMASLDPVRFTEASSSLRDAFGMHEQPAQVDFTLPILPSPPKTEFSPINQTMTVKIYRKIKTLIDADELTQDVEMVQQDGDTIILRIDDSVLFEHGETNLNPKAYSLLRYIADIIRPLPLRLRIEGHADSVTTNPLSNWNISIARSVSVLRFFKKGDHLPLDRMAAIGYGAQKPVATNDTEEGRAKNRRVDFVLKADTVKSFNDSNSNQNEIPF